MPIFKRLFKIALRNIFRNKRRSILTMLILILGCTGLMMVGGFFDSLAENFREQYIHSVSGHIQIDRKDYFEKGASDPFQFFLKDIDDLTNQVEKNPHVKLTVPRLKFSAMVSAGKSSVGVLVLGVDPEKEKQMGKVQSIRGGGSAGIKILEGQDLDASDPYGVILGQGLMQSLGVKVGDSINFIAAREGGTLDGGDYHVRGVFVTVLKDFDDRAMKMDLKQAQKTLGLDKEVHSLLVLLDETTFTEPIRDELRSTIQGAEPLEWITWQEQGAFYRQSKDIFDRIYNTVQIIICVIFFLSIANTINMSLFERIREFGTMMAMGNGRWAIFAMLFMEAFVLGLAGSTLGILVGSGTSWAVSHIGIHMPPIPNGSSGYIATILLSPGILIRTFFTSFFSVILASLIPGYRASHFEITRALGYV